MGGGLKEGEYGKVTYVGGSRKYIVVKEGMRLEEVRSMVAEITDSDLSKHKLWYNLKYDRQMLMCQLR